MIHLKKILLFTLLLFANMLLFANDGESSVFIKEPVFNKGKMHLYIEGLKLYQEKHLSVKGVFVIKEDSIEVFSEDFYVNKEHLTVDLKKITSKIYLDFEWEVWPQGVFIVSLHEKEKNVLLHTSYFHMQSSYQTSKLNVKVKECFKTIQRNQPQKQLTDKLSSLLQKCLNYEGNITLDPNDKKLHFYDKNGMLVYKYNWRTLNAGVLDFDAVKYDGLLGEELLSPMMDLQELFQAKQVEDNEKNVNLYNSNFYESSNSESKGNETNPIYSDLGGTIELELFGLPMNIDFYVTSQDKGRIQKARYFSLDYDKEYLKEKFLETLEAYQTIYSTRKDKVSRVLNEYEKVLGDYTKDLKEQNSKYSELKENIIDSLSEKVKDIDDNIQKIEHQISYYKTLTEQVKSVARYDSINYKNFLESFLSEKEAKDFIDQPNEYGDIIKEKIFSKKWSLSNLNIGNTYLKNPMKSLEQTYIKGLQFGFETPYINSTFYAGKTENLDYFSSNKSQKLIGLSLESKPVLRTSVYLNYIRFLDDFSTMKSSFEDFESVQSLKRNNHDLGLGMKTNVFKWLELRAELQKTIKEDSLLSDSNYNLRDFSQFLTEIKALIPNSTVELSFKYEEHGKYFNNLVTPLQKSGVSIFESYAQGVFLRSRLRSKLQLFYLVQDNLNHTSNHLKWGVDVQTLFKQIPNVSISYQPYSTIVLTDSLNPFANKQILGEVFKTNISYQYKYLTHSWIAVGSVIKSNSEYDNYFMKMLQVNLFAKYIHKERELYLNIQFNKQDGDVEFGQNQNGTSFSSQIGTTLKVNHSMSISPYVEAGKHRIYGNNLGLGTNVRKAFLKDKLKLMFMTQFNYKTKSLNSDYYHFRVGLTSYFNFTYN